MPSDGFTSMLKVFGAGLAVVGLCSVPAVGNAVTRFTRPEAKQDGYEDIDGKATPEAVKAFSAKLPKSFVLISGALGLALSIALLVVTPHSNEQLLRNSLSTGAWVSARH